MKVSEIENFYHVSKCDKNTYYIWNKELNSGTYLNRQFLCQLERSNLCFRIVPSKHLKIKLSESITKWHKDSKDLVLAIDEYVSLLPHHSDMYFPDYREGVFVDLVVSNYLRNLGFKSECGYGDTSTYTLKQENIYGGTFTTVNLHINGLSKLYGKESPSKVDVYLSLDNYSWITVECEFDEDTIIAAIDSILKPLLLHGGVTAFNTSEKLNTIAFDGSKVTVSGLDVQSEPYKTKLKEELLKLIETL